MIGSFRPVKCIGIVAPARKVLRQDLEGPIAFLEQQGFRVKYSESLFAEDNQYAGSDDVRRTAMQIMMDDPETDALLCAKGGYGSVRIVDGLDWSEFVKKRKLLCGFSDATVFHARLNFIEGLESLHSTMIMNMIRTTDEDVATSNLALVNALRGDFQKFSLRPHPLQRAGNAKGKLVGGNLSVLMSLLGSRDFGETEKCILFLEDLDEYLYHIDRMMNALKRAGKLNRIAALVVGSFSQMRDNTVPFGRTAEEIIYDAVKEFDFPVYYNAPSGHVDLNLPLLLGHTYQLESGQFFPA